MEVSQDEFAKQLQISSDDEDNATVLMPDAAGSESGVRRTNSFDLQLSNSPGTPLDGSAHSPEHSNSTTPRSANSSRPGSRSASARSLPRNTIASGYASQGESAVVTLEINIDDAEKGAKRRRATSAANIIRPMLVPLPNAFDTSRILTISLFSCIVVLQRTIAKERSHTNSWKRRETFPLCVDVGCFSKFYVRS